MADEKTDLAKVPEPQKNLTIAVDESSFSSYLDTAKFNQLWRVANVFAGSDIVPEHYRNKPNNCFLALQMATRLEIEPLMFIQNSYVVKGKPGLQAVLVIALVNTKGPFTGPIQWKFDGEKKLRKCTAYATHKITGEICKATVSWAMVEAEGWDKNPKWLNLTDLMFQYRSASFLAKLYCPEVIMGMVMAEELEDIVDQNGKQLPSRPVSNLEEKLTKKVDSTTRETVDDPEKAAREVADLAEVDSFSKPVAENPQEGVQDEPQTTEAEEVRNGVDSSERYFCSKCDGVFADAKGKNKDVCPNVNCLSKGVVDRWSKQ